MVYNNNNMMMYTTCGYLYDNIRHISSSIVDSSVYMLSNDSVIYVYDISTAMCTYRHKIYTHIRDATHLRMYITHRYIVLIDELSYDVYIYSNSTYSTNIEDAYDHVHFNMKDTYDIYGPLSLSTYIRSYNLDIILLIDDINVYRVDVNSIYTLHLSYHNVPSSPAADWFDIIIRYKVYIYLVSSLLVFGLMYSCRTKKGSEDDEEDMRDNDDMNNEDDVHDDDIKKYFKDGSKEMSDKLQGLIDQTNRLTRDHDNIRNLVS